MKFLSKHNGSEILQQKIVYSLTNKDRNKKLRLLLVIEQKGFCAYTEKFIDPIDSVEVEHFNAALKPDDNYYNYYATLRQANAYKKDMTFAGASFFTSLFFHNRQLFDSRIIYVDGMYVNVNPEDEEAQQLIDFLRFNHADLSSQRKAHIERLRDYLSVAGISFENKEAIREFLTPVERRYLLSYITAIEKEFDIHLEDLL